MMVQATHIPIAATLGLCVASAPSHALGEATCPELLDQFVEVFDERVNADPDFAVVEYPIDLSASDWDGYAYRGLVTNTAEAVTIPALRYDIFWSTYLGAHVAVQGVRANGNELDENLANVFLLYTKIHNCGYALPVTARQIENFPIVEEQFGPEQRADLAAWAAQFASEQVH